MLTTIVSTAVVLGVLIFIHELGHFLVARRMGVTVLRFSLGFGPRVFGIQRGPTDYCLSLIPLGGYVKMLGEDAEDEISEEEKAGSFSHQPVGRRLAIVLAGPLANLVLAVALFTGVFAVSGIPTLIPEVGGVAPGSPAEQAGLQAGDRILSINGRPVEDWDTLSRTIEELGNEVLTLEVRREDDVLSLQVEPEIREVKNIFGESVQRPIIGITASGNFEMRRVNPLLAGYHSLVQTWNLSKLFLLTVVKLIQRVLPMETLGGPIMIAQLAGQQAQEGLLHLIHFTALISVNLAILNLLPIPVLDGGHIFFFLMEAVLRRPISVRKMEMAQKVGMFVLILLMVFVFYNDIMRLLPESGEAPVP